MAKRKLAITQALGSICIPLSHSIHLEREMQLAEVIVKMDLIVFPSRLFAVKTTRPMFSYAAKKIKIKVDLKKVTWP